MCHRYVIQGEGFLGVMQVCLVEIESPAHADHEALFQTVYGRKNDFIAFAQFPVVLPPSEVKHPRLSTMAVAVEALSE